jgi:hypothetical protein
MQPQISFGLFFMVRRTFMIESDTIPNVSHVKRGLFEIETDKHLSPFGVGCKAAHFKKVGAFAV